MEYAGIGIQWLAAWMEFFFSEPDQKIGEDEFGEVYGGEGILDAGYWILDTGYWILDAGCWILDAGYRRLHELLILNYYLLIIRRDT